MRTVVKNVLHPEDGLLDMVLEEGRILAFVTAGTAPRQLPRVDGRGYLLLPPLVDGHAHLDKTVLGMEWFCNDTGSRLRDRIEQERAMRKQLKLDPYRQACRYLRRAAGLGVLALRTHVDVDTQNGLSGLEGVLRAREEYRDLVQVEVAAFPQSGLLARPGTAQLLEEAVRMGADLVGGLDPAAVDRDPKGSIDAVFGIAEKYGKGVDIHLHEPGELGLFDLSLILHRTRSLGMQGRVAVSHAFCLGHPGAEEIFADLAREKIHIVTSANAHMPTVPPVLALTAAGVNLCGGNDNVRDMWSPFGSGDMLERAMFIAMRHNFRRDEELRLALDCCTRHGARLLGLSGCGITPGCRGDFVLVNARNIPEAVAACPRERLVFRAGRLIAENGSLL